MSALEEQFSALARDLETLIALLHEADERFWIIWLKRGLSQVRCKHLGGATFVLGCYGGEDSFSDFKLKPELAHADPLRYRNLNARLTELRTRVFLSANAITARRAW
ncbi:MAG: hypothetical protein ACO3Z6_15250 [Pseudomonadales bacterium]